MEALLEAEARRDAEHEAARRIPLDPTVRCHFCDKMAITYQADSTGAAGLGAPVTHPRCEDHAINFGRFMATTLGELRAALS